MRPKYYNGTNAPGPPPPQNGGRYPADRRTRGVGGHPRPPPPVPPLDPASLARRLVDTVVPSQQNGGGGVGPYSNSKKSGNGNNSNSNNHDAAPTYKPEESRARGLAEWTHDLLQSDIRTRLGEEASTAFMVRMLELWIESSGTGVRGGGDLGLGPTAAAAAAAAARNGDPSGSGSSGDEEGEGSGSSAKTVVVDACTATDKYL